MRLASPLLSTVAMQRRPLDLNDTIEPKADRILDFRDSVAPLALLKLTHVFSEMRSNEILECVGQNPTTMADFFKVLPAVSYEIVMQEEFEDRYYRILLKKRAL
jgi:TusA-related sulfurtransferase